MTVIKDNESGRSERVEELLIKLRADTSPLPSPTSDDSPSTVSPQSEKPERAVQKRTTDHKALHRSL